jgi:hypothetical protein
MTTFQWITIPLLLALFAGSAAATVRRRLSLRAGFLWSLLWLAAASAIAWPQLTVRVATLLGIGRGADLVLYLAVVGMFIGFFLVFLRLRRIENNLTKIVRQIAVSAPLEPPPRTPPSPAD